ncbi:MAG: lipopolysaccharide heptosyltransferase II [Kiritimatiellae bacterium]|nr:lipopolysaccharide heptosyltransferase II [Kiritimatiellia bacterium]
MADGRGADGCGADGCSADGCGADGCGADGRGAGEATLVVSPNWLGDAVMAMPAVRRWRRAHPAARLVVLAKPGVAPLWETVEGVDETVRLEPGNRGTFAAGRALRGRGFAEAVILPNSFRSALIPWLARIPRRRGTAFHARWALVNDRVRFSADERRLHQAREDFKIVCGDASGDTSDTGFKPPRLDGAALAALGVPAGGGPLVGVIPGAARGPSKRWPHFAAAARLVAGSVPGVRFAVCGGAGEAALCGETARAIGPAAASLAGKTTLPRFASLLASCDAVLCNDSGGMHLASAAGTPVVAVFGRTDPDKTGPIGPGAIIVRADGVSVSRRIARDDPAAVAALASIAPERVAAACVDALENRNRRSGEGEASP